AGGRPPLLRLRPPLLSGLPPGAARGPDRPHGASRPCAGAPARPRRRSAPHHGARLPLSAGAPGAARLAGVPRNIAGRTASREPATTSRRAAGPPARRFRDRARPAAGTDVARLGCTLLLGIAAIAGRLGCSDQGPGHVICSTGTVRSRRWRRSKGPAAAC